MQPQPNYPFKIEAWYESKIPQYLKNNIDGILLGLEKGPVEWMLLCENFWEENEVVGAVWMWDGG